MGVRSGWFQSLCGLVASRDGDGGTLRRLLRDKHLVGYDWHAVLEQLGGNSRAGGAITVFN